MTDVISRLTALAQLDHDERKVLGLCLVSAAAMVWLGVALGEWALLLELPALFAVTIWLLQRRRRRAAESDIVEDWNFF